MSWLWKHPDKMAESLFARLPESRFRPLVKRPDLDEVVRVYEILPADLEYPINSAGELVDKLGGPGRTFRLDNVDLDPLYLIKLMPSYYFPIADSANFTEKMAELIRANRKQSALSEVDEIVGGMKLTFPVQDRDSLARELSEQAVVWRGEALRPADWVDRVPDVAFPISSFEDFRSLTATLLLSRPIVVGERHTTDQADG